MIVKCTAAILTLALGPGIIAVALAVLLMDGRPIFHRSTRVGQQGRNFHLVKFRTMATHSRGGVTGGDKRSQITPLGHLLRQLRLDELPQLWNVLRGEIGFVGPRPPLPEYVERFPEVYAEILQCRPGITGLATLAFHKREADLLGACCSARETDDTYVRRCIPRKARIDRLLQQNGSARFRLWLALLTGLTAMGLYRASRLPRIRRRRRKMLRGLKGALPTLASNVQTTGA